jgi:hypothetical protein
MILDRDRRLIALRTKSSCYNRVHEELMADLAYIRDHCVIPDKARLKQNRGVHFAAVIGADRNNKNVSCVQASKRSHSN